MTIRIVSPSLVVLVGPSASGKSTWALASFDASQVVSSDALRSIVGEGPNDMRASTDAFDLLEDVVRRRLKRKLLTVVDTLGLDADARERWRTIAAEHGVPCYAVAFDTDAKQCRARNRQRAHQVPSKVLTQQLETFASADLGAEGFAGVYAPGAVEVVPPAMAGAPEAAGRQRDDPVGLRFGLQLPRFDFLDDPGGLAAVAGAAEDAGFSSLWVMDHFIQIPQAGREWDPMLDSWTTLGYLAACTGRVSLGTLVTGITYRNVAHVGKMAATLDVLSGGRAVCGIGAAWFEREHRAYGWDFPTVRERFALLEDALRLYPLLWGPGSPTFEGRAIGTVEAIGYPRPVQDPIPILVGGSGERTTLHLVARYADACNLFGDADTVRHKLKVLHEHCDAAGRDPSQIEVTHLGTVLVGEDRRHVDRLLDELTPSGANRDAFAASTNAGTVDDHVGRFRALAEAGVQHAIVNLPRASTDAVGALAEVIPAFVTDRRR